MSTDYWVPDQDRYEKARPKAAWPTETFFNTGSMKAGGEQIDYGYLVSAHTNGDIYVHFKDSNVLVVGDVASPVKDPELDWITGGWIGGRVDAMDLLLKISNEQTKIVPGTGPVMTRAEFKAERELMEVVRQRLFKQVREGDGPQDMLEGGVMKGLARTWKDPYKFLYAAAKVCGGTITSWTRMLFSGCGRGLDRAYSFVEDRVKRFILAIACVVALAAHIVAQAQQGKLASLIQAGDRKAALDMIRSGADVNEAQPDGTRPIHWAVYRVDYELMEALIAKKAKADVRTSSVPRLWRKPSSSAMPAWSRCFWTRAPGRKAPTKTARPH